MTGVLKSKRFFAVFLAGMLILSYSGTAYAKRRHDTGTGVVVSHSGRTAGLEKAPKPSLKERIEAIMHPKEKAPKVRDNKKYRLQPVDLSDGNIMGAPMATEAQCVNYLLKRNPSPEISVTPEELVSFYYEEATKEGIRPDVAFAQALHETGNFSYGGDVTPAQNNYCGLGATGHAARGGYFPTARIGVRAHIQHLLAYATTRRPLGAIVDPRYAVVRDIYGAETLPMWRDLNGRWAVPGHSYGQSIMAIFREILAEPGRE